MDLKLKGKRALVTGASKGIGRACVDMLTAEGCTVLGVSRSIAPGANAKAADLSQRGVAEEVAAWAGELDILVNNAGLMAFTKALGGASHADGIRVVGINPGPVATDRLISLHKQQAATKFGDESRYEELFKDMSFGRPATAEEIANAVAFLASERSGYTTGTILTIDGGSSNR